MTRNQQGTGDVPLHATEMRLLADLKEHPANRIFKDTSSSDLATLVADIAKNGLQHPIDVLPDGTILAGHRRVQAFKRLKRKEIPCRVRADLAERSAAEQVWFLVTDNLLRRQLGPAERARCMARTVELAMEEARRKRQTGSRTAIKDQVAQRFGVNARTLSRALQLASCPRCVQDAVDEHKITCNLAYQVAVLAKQEQESITRMHAEGQSVSTAVRTVLASQPKARDVLSAAFGKDSLRGILSDLERVTARLRERELTAHARASLDQPVRELYEVATGRTIRRRAKTRAAGRQG